MVVCVSWLSLCFGCVLFVKQLSILVSVNVILSDVHFRCTFVAGQVGVECILVAGSHGGAVGVVSVWVENGGERVRVGGEPMGIRWGTDGGRQ